MGTSRPTGNLLDTIERHSKDIRKIKRRLNSAGVSDHGSLSGLTDDDHTNYLNVARHDADDHSGLLPIDHGTDVTGLLDDDHTQYHTDARASTWHSGLAGAHVTNGDSHNHSGGDGAQIDHGSLAGRGDNDHNQYLLRSGGNGGMTGNLDMNNGIIFDSAEVRTGAGASNNPSFTFDGDTDTGLANPVANEIWFVTGGATKMRLDGGLGQLLMQNTGSNNRPEYAFWDDNDTGMRLQTTSQGVLVAAGSLSIEWHPSNVYLWGARDNTTASSANTLIQSADGRIFRSTSALKYKTDVERADYLADIELVPTKHWRTDDEKWRYGLVADWLVDQDPLLGEHAEILDENTEVENYDTRAVLAIMAAKINRLEEKLATI